MVQSDLCACEDHGSKSTLIDIIHHEWKKLPEIGAFRAVRVLGSLDLLGQAWVFYQRPESLRVLSSISIVPKTEVGLGSMGA